MAITYNIGFKTDSSNIQAQLNVIQRDIDKVFKNAGTTLNQGLSEGIKQASILSDILQKAQTDRGTSFMQMNIALKQAGSSAQEMVSSLSGAGMKGALNTFLTSFASADRNLIGISSKVKDLQHVLSQSIKFNAAMGLQNFVMGQIEGAVTWVRELNDALTEIAIVAPEVVNKMDEVAATIVTGARDLRVAAKDYAEASIIFYQQGLDPAEVDRRTQITIKAARAAGLSVKEMSEQLTAVWNTYQMQGDELERAASVAAKLGAETAAAFEDISEGMQIAASGASMLGVSYESLASIMTTVRETTLQSASVIGNAYKTIFARFTNLKTSGEDAGESLGRISQSLADLGVNVLNETGELRDLDDVIMQLGTTWETYSRKQQIAIAQTVGGVRQYQQFLALMQNFDKYQANLASAQSETGSTELDRQYLESLKSIDSAMVNSTEAWRRAFAGVFESDAQIGFYRTLEGIGNTVNGIVTSLGGLQGILVIAGGLLAGKIAPTIQKIGFGIKEWKDNLTLNSQTKSIDKQTTAMKDELKKMGASDGDIRKVEMTQQAAKQEAILNKIIQEGNGAAKIRAQYLKDQIAATHQLGMEAVDNLEVAKKAADKEAEHLKKVQAREAVEQSNKSAPARTEDENIQLAEKQILLLEQEEILRKRITSETKAMFASGEANQAVASAQEKLDKAQEELDLIKAINEEKRNSGGEVSEEDSGKEKAAKAAVREAQKELGVAKQIAAEKQKQLESAQRKVQQQKTVTQATRDELRALQLVETSASKRNNALKTSEGLLKTMSKHTEGLAAGLTKADLGEDLGRSLSEMLTNLDDGVEGAEELKIALESARDALTNEGSDPTAVLADLNEEIIRLNSNAGLTEEELTNINGALNGAADAANEFNDAQDQLQEQENLVNQTTQDSTMSLTSYFTEIGKVAGGIAILANGFTGLAEAMSNSEAGFGDYLGVAMQLIPAIAMIYGGVTKVVTAIVAEVAARRAGTTATGSDTIAKVINTIATFANTVATQGLTAAMAGLMAVLGPVTIAIIAITAVIIALVAIIAFAINKDKEHKESLEKQAAAAAEAAKKNAEFRDSLREVAKSLADAKRQLDENTISFSEYLEVVNEARQKLIAMSKENPDLKINIAEFDAASHERKMAMLKEKEMEMNSAVLTSYDEMFTKLDERYSQSKAVVDDYGNVMYENIEGIQSAVDFGKGDEANNIRDALSDFQNAAGGYDLEAIAKNMDNIKSQLSDAETQIFMDKMGELNGFSDLVTATAEKTGAEAYLAFSESIGGITQTYNESTMALKDYTSAVGAELVTLARNDEALTAARETSQAIIDEIERLKQEKEELEGDKNSDAEIADIDAQIADLEEQGAEAAEAITAAGEENALAYSDAIQMMLSSSDEMEQKTAKAILALSQATGTAIDDFNIDSAEFGEELANTIELIDASRTDLIGLGEDAAELVNVSLLRSNFQGLADDINNLKEDMSASEKSDWLKDTNEQIQRMNELLAATGGEQIAELNEKFFLLGDSAREAYAKMLENQGSSSLMLQAEKDLVTETLAGIEAKKTALALDLEANRLAIEAKQAELAQDENNVLLQQQLNDLQDRSNVLLQQEIALEQQKENLQSQEQGLDIEIMQKRLAAMTETERALYQYNIALEEFGKNSEVATAAWKDLVQAMADGIGIDADVLEDYTQHIMRTAKASDLLHDSLATNQQMSLKVAAATIRANEGYGKLEGGLEQIKKDLDGINKKEIDIGSQRAMESINELDEALSDILNIDTGTLSLDTLVDPATLKLAEDALNGVEGALWSLQQIAATDFLANLFPEQDLTGLYSIQDEFVRLIGVIDETALAGWQLGQELSSIEGIGNLAMDISANAQEIVRGMQEMGASAAQVQAYFNSMGMEIDGEKETVKTKKTIDTSVTTEELVPGQSMTLQQPQQKPDGTWGTVPVTYQSMNRVISVQPGTKEIEEEQEVFSFSGADGNGGFGGFKGDMQGMSLTNISSGGTRAGAAMAAPANRGGGGRGTGGSGGDKGGGGGGKEPKKVTAKQYGERYRDTEDALEEISRRLTKVSTAEEKAFGLNKLRMIQAKNMLLQEQARQYQKLAAEAKAYLDGGEGTRATAGRRPVSFGEGRYVVKGSDKETLQAMLKELGVAEATFDNDHFISNAEQIKNALNQLAIAATGTKDGLAELTEEQEKAYESQIALLDAVEGQMELINEGATKLKETTEAQLELIHTWLTNKIAEVDLKMELRLRVNAMDVRQLEFLLSRLGDRASAISLDHLIKGIDLSIEKGDALIKNVERLKEIIGNINNIDALKTGDHQVWFEGEFGKEAWQQFLDDGGVFTQEMMDNLADKADQIMDTIEELHEKSAQIFAMYRQAAEVFLRDFDRLLAIYDDHATMLDSWKELWMLAGTPWKNQRMELDLMTKSISNQTSKIKGLRQEQEFLEHAATEAQKVYEAAVAAHGPLMGGDPEDLTQNQKIVQDAYESWKDLESQAHSTAATVMSETAAMANMYEELATRAAEIIRSEFQSALGGIFADLEGFSAMFEQRKTMDQFFEHEEDAGLRLGKLYEQMQEDPAALKDAAKWEEYLNSVIEKRIVKTETIAGIKEHEVWVTKEGVQLTDKQLAIIEEQFELEKQKAAFEDAQQAKNTMRLARDASGNWNYVYSDDREDDDDKAQAIEDRLANIRKMHRDAVDELTDFWAQQMLEWEEFEANVDQRRYAQDERYRAQVDKQRAWYQEMMGTLANQINIHLDAIDMDFTETTLSTILNLSDMEVANDKYVANINSLSQAFQQSWQENQDALHNNLAEMGIDMDNFEDTVREETDKIIDHNKENERSIEELNRTGQQQLSEMSAKIQQWSQQWQSEISALIRALQELLDWIRQVQQAQAGNVDGFDYKTDYAQKMIDYEAGGGTDETVKRQIAGERFNKQMAAYKERLDLYKNDAAYMQKVKDEWTAKIAADGSGKTIDQISQQDYIDYYLKNGQFMFDTGGIATGPMVAGLAMDGRKELVLNADDTKNMLAALEITRAGIAAYLGNLGSIQASAINRTPAQGGGSEATPPQVIIKADFPNVTAREEIEAAFSNLVNQSAQYQLKPRD